MYGFFKNFINVFLEGYSLILYFFSLIKESKMETLDVESEKASEKTEDEEENESIAEEKKEDSDEEMERDSGDEAVSDQGDQSQSEKDEPCTSMKEFLMDKAGSESVPGSPASQVSQGCVPLVHVYCC